MIDIEILDQKEPPEPLSYVVIAARADKGWVFVRHRERGGYEMPAGHPDEGESSEAAAARELYEETGALKFEIFPVCFYSVTDNSGTTFGRLFFAEITSFGKISDNEEIAGIRFFKGIPGNLSLREVMSFLFKRAEQYINKHEYQKRK